jgi:hypothetical protein
MCALNPASSARAVYVTCLGRERGGRLLKSAGSNVSDQRVPVVARHGDINQQHIPLCTWLHTRKSHFPVTKSPFRDDEDSNAGGHN